MAKAVIYMIHTTSVNYFKKKTVSNVINTYGVIF